MAIESTSSGPLKLSSNDLPDIDSMVGDLINSAPFGSHVIAKCSLSECNVFDEGCCELIKKMLRSSTLSTNCCASDRTKFK